jgi:signal peptidase II
MNDPLENFETDSKTVPTGNPAPSQGTSSSPLFTLLFIALVVLMADQATKMVIHFFLPLYDKKEIIPGFFNLFHVRNTGAAFSFLAGEFSLWRQLFFIGVSLVAIGVIFYIHGSLKEEDHWPRRALGLILGGAFGNLVDRLRLGEVIDFLDFYVGAYHWPAFNVADSCITIGCFILLYHFLRSR